MEYVYDVWSTGWTGYSFNTDLFPDPDAFLKKLKDDGYHTTFNIHPSMFYWITTTDTFRCAPAG